MNHVEVIEEVCRLENWWTEFVYSLSSSGMNEYSKSTKSLVHHHYFAVKAFDFFEQILNPYWLVFFIVVYVRMITRAWSIYTYRHVTWNGYLKIPSFLQPMITYCSWLQHFNWKLCLEMLNILIMKLFFSCMKLNTIIRIREHKIKFTYRW